MEHACSECGLVHGEAEAEVIVAEPGTNEHDVAIAEAEAEAQVEIAQIEAESRAVEAAEFTDQVEARVEGEAAMVEAAAEVAIAEVEAEGAIVETEIEAEAEIVEAEIEAAEPHDEPDGDEGVGELAHEPEVMAVEVPPQLSDEPQVASAARPRTMSAFRRHRMGGRR